MYNNVLRQVVDRETAAAPTIDPAHDYGNSGTASSDTVVTSLVFLGLTLIGGGSTPSDQARKTPLLKPLGALGLG